MRWVQHAVSRPMRCAVVPFIGNSNAKKGFIDTGQDLHGWDPHVYVSIEAVEEMARFIGWQPAHVQAGAKEQVSQLKTKLQASEDECERLEQQLAAVQVLKNNGFAQAKPPGRPRKAAA